MSDREKPTCVRRQLDLAITERTQDQAAWISVGVDNHEVLRAILQSSVWIDPCSSQAVRADGGSWPAGRCWLLSQEAQRQAVRHITRR